MPEQDLDARIRGLVARAVADAPPAPDLDPTVVALEHRPDHRRAWWVGGGAALLAAAATITMVVLIADTDERISTPATTPTVPATPAPDTTPGTTAGSTPGTVDDPATSTTTSILDATDPQDPGPSVGGVVLTSGTDGVTAYRDGIASTIWTEPAIIALATPDGQVLLQPDGEGGAPLALDPATGATSPLPADHPDDWNGLVRLHDVELVAGRELLLYSLVEGTDRPDADTEAVYLLDLGTGERELLLPPAGAAADGSVRSRLTMSTSGRIVGTLADPGGVSFLSLAVPGSPAAERPLTAAQLGLAPTYPGCDVECPRLFAISSDGRTIAWVEGEDNAELVVHEDGSQQRIPLPFPPQETSLDIAPDGSLLLARAPAPVQAVRVARDGTVTELAGTVATVGPAGRAEVPGGTAPTAALVTAGADGVAVLDEDGEVLRRVDEPAEVAFLTPGGAVIFQAPRPGPGAEPGEPMIWRPDGSVEPLLAEPQPGQSHRLYDVAEVAGVPTVLAGRRTRPADGNPDEFREQLLAVAMVADGWTTSELGEIHTWEAGYTGLSLSADGTVIGTHGESVTTSFVALAVPGSPADEAGVPDPAALGVEAAYGDCETCPQHFTISADGTTIAWLADGGLVVHDVATGTTQGFPLPDLDGLPVHLDVRRLGADTFEVLVDRWSADGEPADTVHLRLTPAGGAELPLGAEFASFAP